MKNYFRKMRGTSRTHSRQSWSHIFWSWAGSFTGIFFVWQINYFMGIQENANLFLVGSFGASAVLIYGVPMSDFSQPRNFVGGHLICAVTGVAVYTIVPGNVALAAALAVSIAVAAMLVTHTTHPPGGATALIAVIGGDPVTSLGFKYVLAPVLTGALIMLLVALFVNNLSSSENRHYPKFWI